MIKFGDNTIGKVYFGSELIGKAQFGERVVFLSGSSGTTTYGVTLSLTGCTSSNSATRIAVGDPYTTTITANTDFVMSLVTITMSGDDITSTTYDASTGVVSIAAVTGPIRVSAVAVFNGNAAYSGIRYDPVDGGSSSFGMGVSGYMISPLFSTVNTNSLTFSTGDSTRVADIIFFDSEGRYKTYFTANANPRTISLGTNSRTKYVALCFKISNLASAYVYDNTNDVYLFKGDELDSSNIHDWTLFREESVLASAITWENERGDFENWNFSPTSAPRSNNAKEVHDDPMYRIVKTSTSTAAEYPTIISSYVNLPKNNPEGKSEIEFSVGAVYASGDNPCILYYNDTAKTGNYNMPTENPRTVTLYSGYDRARLITSTTLAPDAYIKDVITGTYLWRGPQPEPEPEEE